MKKYYAAPDALLDDEKELYRVYIGIDGDKTKVFAAVFGNSPQVALQNAQKTVEALNTIKTK